MFDDVTKTQNIPIITIDGPSGTGKGTISHKLAHFLGWHYLDSGAIYRVLAYVAKSKKIDFNEYDKLITLAKELNLSFAIDDNFDSQVFVDKRNVSDLIRSEECGQYASKIAAIPVVREALLERQRSFALSPGLVTDGRDMGTVVFPDAVLKIFLYASIEERAKRRFLQLQKQSNSDSLQQITSQLIERDERDTNRAVAPLLSAFDAILVDTSNLSIDVVFSKVLDLVKQKNICCTKKGGG